MQKENKKSEPCDECLVLPLCKNKSWLNLLTECDNLARYVSNRYAIPKEEIIHVKVPMLKRWFEVSKNHDGDIVIGPRMGKGYKK